MFAKAYASTYVCAFLYNYVEQHEKGTICIRNIIRSVA